jgi:hypothetical protein
VKAGTLSARNFVAGQFHDVANQGALGANVESHNYARVYFRPRNPYHLRTEGIKCLCHPYRQDVQSSIPVTFLFDFASVMTLEGVKFTKGNIQRAKNTQLEGDTAFDTLDFNSIYHDDSVSQNEKDYIHDCRMAEVMIPNNLPLDPHLKAIFFRTRWDLETFRFLLQGAGAAFNGKVQVEQITNSLYMHMGLYIIDLDVLQGTLHMRFHLPIDYSPKDGNYKVKIEQSAPGVVGRIYEKDISLQKGSLAVSNFLSNADAIWRITLEDVLAFNGRLPHTQSEVFGPR